MGVQTKPFSNLISRLKFSADYLTSQPTALGLILFLLLAVLFAFEAPLKATLPALCFVSAGAFLAGSTRKRTIEAERFILRDEQGKMRAVIGMSPTGPSVAIYDREVRKRLEMALRQDEPRLVLYDAGGNPMSWLFCTRGASGLALAGKGAARGVEILAGARGNGVALCDEGGTERARIEYREHAPSVNLRDAKGNLRAALQLMDNQPVFALYDGRNKRHGGWAATPDGSALGLYDAEGKVRVALVVNATGPSVTVLDSDEKVTFSTS
jgi:hypothetical protein